MNKANEDRAKLRAQIFSEIAKLEKQYGERAVRGAFAKHIAVQRKRRALAAKKREVEAEIEKLSR